MAHEQVAFYLLERIERHTDHDQQAGAAEELGKLLGLGDAQLHRKGRQDGGKADEQRPRQRHPREDVVDELAGLFAGPDAGDKTTLALHRVGHLLGVDGDGGVEVREEDTDEEEDDRVAPAREVQKQCPETLHEGAIGEELRDGAGHKHDRLGEDDGHHPGSVDADGQVLRGAAVDLAPDDALGILHRHAARALRHQHHKGRHNHQHPDLKEEQEQVGRLSELVDHRLRQEGDNTDGDDQRDAVADAAFGDPFAEPHHKHRPCRQHNHRRNHKKGRVDYDGRRHRALQEDGIAYRLEGRDAGGAVARQLCDFAASFFALALQLLEVRHGRSQKLNDDRRGDVGHDAQRKDARLQESAPDEEVEEPEEVIRIARCKSIGERHRIDARQRHIGPDAVNHQNA